MGRVYKKKIGAWHYGDRPDSTVEDALNKIVNGEMSILAASKKYKIPYGTLHNRHNGKRGNKPINIF